MDKRWWCIVAIFAFVSYTSKAQTGRISGVVIDGKTGSVLPGATITIEPGQKVTASDLNGKFSFSGLIARTYVLETNFLSYQTKKDTVVIKTKDPVDFNIVLQPLYKDLQQVEVRSTRNRNRETANALLVLQKNRASVSDGISAEVIKKTPDRNASDVLKRVSGASLQNDKFAVIRGLNDRYNVGLLNAAPLPSSEADRKAFAFDIFPSNMLESIVIAKTATPDVTGDFAGGVIFINTRGIPEKNFASLSLGTAINTLATFKDKSGYTGGRWNFIDKKDFDGTLPGKENFPNTYQEQEQLAKQFKNNWGLTTEKFTPNYNGQFAFGRNFQRKGKDFAGMLISATYNKSFRLFDISRKVFENSTTNPNDPSIKVSDYLNTINNTQLLAGVLASLTVKPNYNNIFNFRNILNYSGDDRLISTYGERDINPLDNSSVQLKQHARVFSGNRFYSTQLGGEHYISKAFLRINWSGFYSNIIRKNPSRNDTYVLIPDIGGYVAQTGDGANDNDAGTMKEIKNTEHVTGGSIDISKKIKTGNTDNEIKIGAIYQNREKDFKASRIGFAPSNNFDYNIIYQPIDSLFQSANMGENGFKLVNRTAPFDKYDGTAKTLAYYAMLDQRFGTHFRAIYGVRVEHFDMKLNSVKNDFVTPLNYANKVNSILPSFNFVYSPNSKQNIRLCYSQTVNRPEFREVAPFLFYDYSTNFTVTGNDTLKTASITNFDLRYEVFPGRGQVMSVTGFYKGFKLPVETVYQLNAVNPNISYQNSPDGKAYGFETEIRMVPGAILNLKSGFLNNLTLIANYSYIFSKTIIPFSQDTKIARRLQGQSPYVFNAGFIYQDIKNGFSLSAFANRSGARIFYGGNNYFPDVWENGRTVVDAQLSKTLLKQKLELSLNIKDLLSQKLVYFEDKNNNKKYDKLIDNDVQYFTFGKQVSLTASIKL